MTQTSNRFLDDLARLMTDAAGAAQGLRRDAEAAVRAQMERLLQSMDVVTREEFEVVREMAIAARDDAERLTARVAELEKRLSDTGGEKTGEASRPTPG